jgi:dGTPase
MFAYVYECPVLEKERQKAEHVVLSLLDMIEKRPHLLPEETQKNFSRFGKLMSIVDYVAGLTDLSAVNLFNYHFVPTVTD